MASNDYDALLEKADADVKKWLTAKFDSSFENSGVSMKKVSVPGESINMFYGEKKLSVSAEKVDQVNWSMTSEVMRAFDKDTLRWEYVTISDDVRVVYQLTKLGWPLWNRSFVTAWKRTKWDDGSLVHIWTACEHEKYPEQPKDDVRGRCTIAAVVLTPTDDGKCIFKRLLHVSPEGNLPGAVVNALSAKHVSHYLNWLEGLAKK